MNRLASGSSKTLKVYLLAGATALVFAVFTVFAVSWAEAAPYTQVVDNATKNHFLTYTEWHLNDYNREKRGGDYRVARPAGKGHAGYRIKTPVTGFYTVCASWPANSRYNPRTPIKIKTTGGTRVKLVNQQRNGGKWNRLGTWRLQRGDGYRILVSRKSGRPGWIVADAFKIIKSPDSSGVPCRKPGTDKVAPPDADIPIRQAAVTGESVVTGSGKSVVKAAAKYTGTPYYLGGLGDCVPGKQMDCSCLIRAAYSDATGIDDLPDSPSGQWNYGREVSTPQPGDIVFYKEGTSGVTHNGIYAGNGEIIHASGYFGEVVRSSMRWAGDGYIGARRLL